MEDSQDHVAVVLHYEGACMERWKLKFKQTKEQSEESIKLCMGESWEGYFPYYCDSIEAFQLHPESDNAEVWQRWKLRENRSKETLVAIDPFSNF